MAKKQSEKTAALIKEVEALAKRLRAQFRKSAKQAGLPTSLKAAATQLRKQATVAAADRVERYVTDALEELRNRTKDGAKPPAKAKTKTKAKAKAPARTAVAKKSPPRAKKTAATKKRTKTRPRGA